MSRIINTFKWIGKNPKKSIFLFLTGSYAANYVHEKYTIKKLLRDYCTEAKKYGDVKVGINAQMKKVLVILNPAANKKQCEEDFNTFCAPILYLAGFSIEIFKTSSESHAIRYIEEELTELPDAIVVAGGDGMLSETITGLLRRAEVHPTLCPVGVLPIGMTNAFSLKLTNPKERPMNKVEKVKSMADASLAIVKGKVQKKDVMKIQLIDSVDGEEPKKPIYAVGSLHWGAFRDIVLKKERYWVTGPLRTYTAFLFNGFHRSDIQWNCKADLMYTDPCSGCSNCFVKQESRVKKLHNARWWAKYTPIDKENTPDYSKVLNPNCTNNSQASFDSVEFILSTNTMENGDESKPKMTIKIDSTPDNYGIDFILNSWKRLWNQKYQEIPEKRTIEARSITLLPERPPQENPEGEDEKESFYTIDNENYEVKPVKITLIPQRVEFFAL